MSDKKESPLPERIQLSRRKGWRMPPNTLKVDRSMPWGNPFTPTRREDKAYCAKQFECMLAGYICTSCKSPTPDKQMAYLRFAKTNIHKLRGKNLACWCGPAQPCHADVLLRAANAKQQENR